MSAGKELWDAILAALKANVLLAAMVDGIHDKAPTSPWKAKGAYITRGPFFGSSDDADCIAGQEITAQIDIWSRSSNRWNVDEIIEQVCASLHGADLPLGDYALATCEVRLWRNVDDPDPLTQHGLVQVVALVEAPD